MCLPGPHRPSRHHPLMSIPSLPPLPNDPQAALAKGGVSLSQAQVSPSAVTSAVQKAWGVPPTLVCVQG